MIMAEDSLHKELERQRDEIARQKKEIIYSLQYASLIQSALLPADNILERYLHDHFVLYLPKDIISGDFYWLAERNDSILFAAADCTGHGVPGALMSILGITFLNEVLQERCQLKANRILNQLREKIMKALHQTGEAAKSKDGMDIAMCIFKPDSGEIQYAGANNPLYRIRDKELEEIRPDKMPIGISGREELSFTNHIVKTLPGDIIYLFSDGFADQFGGPMGKKFKYKPFKELLLEIHQAPMMEQKEILQAELEKWKGDLEQVDDILIMGVRF
jgi:serine phosphatase RsbU (regulator of sigma subunit)